MSEISVKQNTKETRMRKRHILNSYVKEIPNLEISPWYCNPKKTSTTSSKTWAPTTGESGLWSNGECKFCQRLQGKSPIPGCNDLTLMLRVDLAWLDTHAKSTLRRGESEVREASSTRSLRKLRRHPFSESCKPTRLLTCLTLV